MTNIGSTRSGVAHLIEVLVKIARDIDRKVRDLSTVERRIHEKRVRSLTHEQPPLPDFSAFHPAFRRTAPSSNIATRDGDVRTAFFLSYDDENCEYVGLNEATRAINSGRELVSALFVIPYPPGFPISCQVRSSVRPFSKYLRALDVREIHGFRPELGFRIFTATAFAKAAMTAARAASEAETRQNRSGLTSALFRASCDPSARDSIASIWSSKWQTLERCTSGTWPISRLCSIATSGLSIS
jgi:arginine decarboxylase